MGWQIWIDRGGTFTDIIATNEQGQLKTLKLLSDNPLHYQDSCTAGIMQIMGLTDSSKIPQSHLDAVKMGTTIGTNALLEHTGEPIVFVTTQGFKDAIRIGYQNRPDLFSLHIKLPKMLYKDIIEINERINAQGDVIKPLDISQAHTVLQQRYNEGYRSIAIVLMHAYRFPMHEVQLAKIAFDIGFENISTSHKISSLIKFVSRGDTTLVDAYLSNKLLTGIQHIQQHIGSAQLSYMQSNGGVCNANCFQAKDSILSGPAGGVVGAVNIAKQAGFDKVITFDMGGTSTDIAHFAGEFERSHLSEMAGIRITTPMLNIHTIAAGGGSITAYKQQRFQVGPHSAGANPGPASYGNQGPLTITDCNVLLGKIIPQYFPHVFGTGGKQPLDDTVVKDTFTRLTKTINASSEVKYTIEQVASGFIEVAINNMANAIKRISIQQGHDVSQYTLVAFGGAGGQHACLVAEQLGVNKILLSPLAGVLSAYGIGIADTCIVRQQTIEQVLTNNYTDTLAPLFAELKKTILAELANQKIVATHTQLIYKIYLKYAATNTSLPITYQPDYNLLVTDFTHAHYNAYGFVITDRELVIDMISLELIKSNPFKTDGQTNASTNTATTPLMTTQVYSKHQWHIAPIFNRQLLARGQRIIGPAIIVEENSTIVLEQNWESIVTENLDLLLTCTNKSTTIKLASSKVDPIMVEIFNNLFMAIAEQMGEALVNTAYSVNIKERRDFSCALFDSEGELIANAPHIPVHLGSMSESVKEIIKQNLTTIKPGDAYMLNDPYHGGTHLPDVTIINPVFSDDDTTPVFYIASRAHHADIGGITPGSIPAHSSHIEEEGILFDNIKIINQGDFNEAMIMRLLHENKFPARNPKQNMADFKAQIAANQQGINELHKLIGVYGLKTVLSYTMHVQDNAEHCVRTAIASLTNGQASTVMDNGVKINCTITVNSQKKEAIIDFTGSSEQGMHNFNAPRAVSISAILYVFRCLVKTKIPLNAGCLRPLKLIIPENCVLNPKYPAAVVAGNVETSQCIVDTLFEALGVLANSQGTMNNVIFGNGTYQYYETICGGSGAGQGFNGASAVQTHMTNSLLTDPEVFELRYPAMIDDFHIRQHSGGDGKWCGGNGVIRKIRFLEPMSINIKSNRRSTCAKGIEGGLAGQSGENYVTKANGEIIKLAASDSIEVDTNDILVIATPGGGGYGEPSG